MKEGLPYSPKVSIEALKSTGREEAGIRAMIWDRVFQQNHKRKDLLLYQIEKTQQINVKEPIIVYCEIIYVLAIITTTLGVALMTKSSWGNSSGTAMAYILSCRFPYISFGVWSYLVQGTLIGVMMVIIRQAKMAYFLSFATAVASGYCLDVWMWVLTDLQPDGIFQCAFSFFTGFFLSGIGFMLFIKSGLPVIAYELFVREMMRICHISLKKVKIALDSSLLGIDFVLSLIFFQRIIGIGIGTIISTAAMGLYMNQINGVVDRYFAFVPLWPAKEDIKGRDELRILAKEEN